jgi:hypothetical protein
MSLLNVDRLDAPVFGDRKGDDNNNSIKTQREEEFGCSTSSPP